MTHWHYMTLELVPEDQLVRPMIGPETDLSREQAHQHLQGLLDRLGARDPQIAQLAATWRAGAKDDTVFAARFIWSIFECTRRTCQVTFAAVLEEWAGILSRSGMAVDVARLPEA